MAADPAPGGWQFWADQGGTFTDLIGRAPDGRLFSTKVLSAAGAGQAGAVERGMGLLLKSAGDPDARTESIQIGTTLGTNALLQRKTARVALLTTAGIADFPRIGHQQRPDLFALQVRQWPPVHARVVEIDERLDADGRVLKPLDEEAVRRALQQLAAEGFDAVAVCLLHSWRNPEHERRVGQLARQAGLAQVSVSHELLPQIRLVGRGDTTVADAALAPVIAAEFDPLCRRAEAQVRFMQSNGHLALAEQFRGCDSVLSGPAGGVGGGVAIAAHHGLKDVIGFDMGGTSTDVWHFSGELERRRETQVAGCSILAPTLDVHSIAAGGGSVLRRHLGRLRVGPASAGARPGPASYSLGGPATVTDANFCTGRLLPQSFPPLFGPGGDQRPDPEAARRALAALDESVGEIAEAFLAVACDQMARAVKLISMQRGYDPADCTLLCLGGAAGQHLCRVAERLEMKRALAHPMSGVLSALGVGMARRGALVRQTLDLELAAANAAQVLQSENRRIGRELRQRLEVEGLADEELEWVSSVALLYKGTDVPLEMPLAEPDELAAAFAAEHLRRYGYRRDDSVLIESLVVEARERGGGPDPRQIAAVTPVVEAAADSGAELPPSTRIRVGRQELQAEVRPAEALSDDLLQGPALVVNPQFTLAVEPGWSARALEDGSILLEKAARRQQPHGVPTADRQKGQASAPKSRQQQSAAPAGDTAERSPAAMLELFIGLYGNVAERMGTTLQQTASSINIRERLDYSCALFSAQGELVANAPHIPVHIGSMSESVRALIAEKGERLRVGDFYASNAPYRGGTHLPDITVMTAFEAEDADGAARFFLAVRGHHAEIGGIEPGSMPAGSQRLEQEGVLFDNTLIESAGQFRRAELQALLTAGDWPSRDPELNLRDLGAQIAACRAGIAELERLIARYGTAQSLHWAERVLASGEEAVRALARRLKPGQAVGALENGAPLAVRVEPDGAGGELLIDFSGCGAATADNFNAPAAVTRAVVLYVLRCLVREDIPLNEGCLRPVRLEIPPGSVLAAEYPSAVAAGNVETSQTLCNLLLQALGAQAGSQGTMNNLSFGNEDFQYYETLGGGNGAGPHWDGATAVHSHMTNSRLTDPEILESRMPVRLERLEVRGGSGGSGRWRGGDGMVRQLRFMAPVSCSIISSSRAAGGKGLAGGSDGAPGRNVRVAADGTETTLPACINLTLAAGEAIRIETPGAGGYGSPEESGEQDPDPAGEG